MLEAYVTNLGRYNEGHLDGAWLKLPATTEDVQALLKRIHIDGVMYEEIFITDYETDIPGLSDCMGEYESIDELNYLATLIDDMDQWELEQFAAAVEYGDHTGNVKDLINLAQNLECYELYADIADDDDLGRYYIEEMGSAKVPEFLQNYIDYEACGRDVRLDEGGSFVDNGYIVENGGYFIEYYSGRNDIPDEHRIFAYPEKASICDTLKDFKQMIDGKDVIQKEHPKEKEAER